MASNSNHSNTQNGHISTLDMRRESSVAKKTEYEVGPCCVGSHVYTGPCTTPTSVFEIFGASASKSFKSTNGSVKSSSSGDATKTNVSSDAEANQGREAKTGLDGGYGWLIVLGCFLSHIITGGFDRSDGVYYIEFRSRYNKSSQLTAWPGAIVASLRFVLGPLASAICNRYSVRTAVMLGGVIFTLGVLLSGFATDFYLLFLYYGFLQGVGRGLFSGPALIIVNKYFNKRRSLAIGLGTSGVGIGTFAIVPLTQYLFDNYSFQGTFLILSGIAFNVILVAMLYRPLSWHKKYNGIPLDEDTSKKTDVSVISKTDDVMPGAHPSSATETEPKVGSEEMGRFDRSSNNLLMIDKDESKERRDSISDKIQSEVTGCMRESLNILFPVEVHDDANKSERKLFDFVLLRNPPFLLFCFSIFLFTLAFKAAFTFMAALAEARGISVPNAALILSISGATDAFGRIGAGIVLGFPRIKPYRHVFFNSFIFALAAVSMVMPQLQTFVDFSLVCGLYGVFTGAYISQKSVVLADMLGADQISNSFGLLICFQGFGILIGLPLSGALKDLFGTYDGVFYLGGASMIVAGTLMLVSNILMVRQRKSQQRQREEEKSKSP